MDLKVFLIFLAALIYSGNAFECYSTLGTNKKWNDPGNPTECKLEAGYSIRKCVKFKTDSRPGKIIRDCDHVYEKLFSYNVMNTQQKDGCFDLDANVNGKPETGKYCVCSTDLCNGDNTWD